MNAAIPTPSPSALLRIKEAASRLCSSDKTVRRLIDSNQLESVKIRGLRLVREASLIALMNKGTS